MLVHMDVRSVLSTIFRQIWKFLLVFVPIILIGLIYILATDKQFQSEAKVIVKFGQDARPEVSLDQRYQGGLSAEEKRGLVQSNLNILVSRDLAEALLQEATIKKVYPHIAKLNASDEEKMNAAIKTFHRDLSAKTESDAGVIRIGVLNTDPAIAQVMLKGLVNLFLEKQSEVFGNPQMDVLREQAETTRQRLEKATEDLHKFKSETGIASIDEELTLLLQQRADLVGYMSRRTIGNENPEDLNAALPEDAISTNEADYEAAQSGQLVDDLPQVSESKITKYEALPARISKPGDTSRLPVVEDKQKKIEELKSKEAELLLTYKPSSQIVQNIRENIEIETQALQEAVEALNVQIADLDSQIAQKQEHRVTYDTLTRQVEQYTEAYATAQSRLQAAEVNNDLNERKITRISVIEEPSLPVDPAKPNKMIILALCLLAGAALGSALGFGTELLDATFSRPEQVSAELKRPVLASFSNWYSKTLKPLPPTDQWKQNIDVMIKSKTVPSLFTTQQTSEKRLQETELLALYQSITSALPDKKAKIINVASSYEGEGATTVSQELAGYVATKLGLSVLMVGHEGLDIPGGTFASFGVRSSLLDAAQGRTQVKDVILSAANPSVSNVAYAYLSSAGAYDGLITSVDNLARLFDDLKKTFSLIIIATPGVMTRPSGLTVGKIADGVVFVIESEKTRAPVVKQALQNIAEKGGNVLGTVLNKQIHYIPAWLYKRL